MAQHIEMFCARNDGTVKYGVVPIKDLPRVVRIDTLKPTSSIKINSSSENLVGNDMNSIAYNLLIIIVFGLFLLSGMLCIRLKE
jgi:hypothetical protein